MNVLKFHTKRDPGAIVTDTLDVTKQCVMAANTMLGMINRAIKYKTKEVDIKLK